MDRVCHVVITSRIIGPKHLLIWYKTDMKKARIVARNSKTGRVATKAIGGSKAKKFIAVEGMALTGKSSRDLARLKASGLKGNELRTAITGSFRKK